MSRNGQHEADASNSAEPHHASALENKSVDVERVMYVETLGELEDIKHLHRLSLCESISHVMNAVANMRGDNGLLDPLRLIYLSKS